MSMDMFNKKHNYQLIRHVKKYPCLYDEQNPDYREKEVTRNAWKAIAQKLGLKKRECKTNWKMLKQDYLNGKISCEKTSKKLKFLDALFSTNNNDKNQDDNTVFAVSTPKKMNEAGEIRPLSPEKSSPILYENEATASNCHENDSDIEEIQPTIECIEIDSSCHIISDADEKIIDFSIETQLNELWRESSAIDFLEFSTFINGDVLKCCRNFSPGLLYEIRDEIQKIMENARLKSMTSN